MFENASDFVGGYALMMEDDGAWLIDESGWRGADILNLRYDSCLDYVWNEEEKYVPYLCREITETGIPLLKIQIRQDVGCGVPGRRTEERSGNEKYRTK